MIIFLKVGINNHAFGYINIFQCILITFYLNLRVYSFVMLWFLTGLIAPKKITTYIFRALCLGRCNYVTRRLLEISRKGFCRCLCFRNNVSGPLSSQGLRIYCSAMGSNRSSGSIDTFRYIRWYISNLMITL